jgi:hypothetical protein
MKSRLAALDSQTTSRRPQCFLLRTIRSGSPAKRFESREVFVDVKQVQSGSS